MCRDIVPAYEGSVRIVQWIDIARVRAVDVRWLISNFANSMKKLAMSL